MKTITVTILLCVLVGCAKEAPVAEQKPKPNLRNVEYRMNNGECVVSKRREIILAYIESDENRSCFSTIEEYDLWRKTAYSSSD